MKKVFILLFILHFTGTTYSKENIYPPPGKLIDLGGRKIHLYCIGEGTPAVIIESGLSSYSLDWVYVQPEVAKKTKICTYDRAGYGWSDPGPKPRTVRILVDELREILGRARIEPPYILVGHSLGGILVQYFAYSYPEDVAGVVLVDSLHKDFRKRAPESKMRGFTGSLKTFVFLGVIGAPLGIPRLLKMPSSIVVEKLPAEIQREAYWLTYQPKTYQAIYDEIKGLDLSEKELGDRIDVTKFPKIPVIVLSAQQPRDYPPFLVSTGLFGLWKELQRDFVNTIPTAKLVLAEKSGHFIQLDEPELVVRAIEELVVR